MIYFSKILENLYILFGNFMKIMLK